MNKKLKITLNVTTLVLNAVESYLREKRYVALVARVAALEEQLDNHKTNHAPKTSMTEGGMGAVKLHIDDPYSGLHGGPNPYTGPRNFYRGTQG